MRGNLASKIVSGIRDRGRRSTTALNSLRSSSSHVSNDFTRPPLHAGSWAGTRCASRESGWRVQRIDGREFRSLTASQLGIPEPIEEVRFLSDIVPEHLVMNRAQHLKAKPLLQSDTLKFGTEYTDHMLQIAWTEGAGWGVPSIDPLGPIPVHPCAQVLHYALECFEGMKAFKTQDGEIRLFRPDMNMDRLSRSAARLLLPTFDKVALLECIKALLRVERAWVPDKEGFSLYIRPTMISTYPHLGVGPPRAAAIFCVLSPVGPYFAGGLEPIKLLVDKKHARAFPGGIGDCKAGGNYAPTILPQVRAAERGCSQVLYVLDDGKDGGSVGECGAMNVFYMFKKGGKMELATPPLNGLILPGVTRDSVLSLTRSFEDFQVSERTVSMNEIEEAGKNGELVEVFGTGTACLVQPIIGLVMEDGGEVSIPFDERAAEYWMQKPTGAAFVREQNEPFSLSGRLTRALLDIQYGRTPSKWSVSID